MGGSQLAADLGARGEERPLRELGVSCTPFPAMRCCPVALRVKSKVLAEACRDATPLFLLSSSHLFRSKQTSPTPTPLGRVPSSSLSPPALSLTPLSPFHQQTITIPKAYGASSVRPPLPRLGTSPAQHFRDHRSPHPTIQPSGLRCRSHHPARCFLAGDHRPPFLDLSGSGSSSIKWE